MARGDSYLLKISLVLTLIGGALAVRAELPSEGFKLLFVGIGAALLLPRALTNARVLPHVLRLALAIWLLGLALSTSFALDPLQALMGSYERAQGTICLLICVILAMARVPKLALTPVVACASIVVSFWACVQALGIEQALSAGNIQWQDTQGFGARVFAGFGNPVNLGNWLSIAFAYLLVQWRDTGYGWRLGLPCVFAVVALCLSGARAAMLAALIVGISIYWSALGAKSRFAVALTLLLATLAMLNMPNRSASIDARLVLWQNAMTHPTLVNSLGQPDPYPSVRRWLGYGPDLQSAALANSASLGQFADRAHNAVLDLWLSTGLWGVASTMLLALTIWRTSKHPARLQGVLFAAAITWSVSFGLSADKSLLALILGALWQDAPDEPQQPSTWRAPMLITIAVLFVWLSYRPLPAGAPASDYMWWRKPERAIANFRIGQKLYFTQPEAAGQAFQEAQFASPWRGDLAHATMTLPAAKK